MFDLAVLVAGMTFQPFMQFHRTLEQQEKTAEQKDQVTAGNFEAGDGEKRCRQRHNPGDGGKQYKAHAERQAEADKACLLALVFGQFVGKDRDEDEIVDAEDDF
ncbi:hypothetical protein D3C87_1950750 [compost metagenome]